MKKKQKVGILTFHRADNFGAVLQALALQETLLKYTDSVEIIDYHCNAIEINNEHKLPGVRKNLIKWLNSFLKWSRIRSKNKRKKERFSEFRKNFHCSDKIVQTYNRALLEEKYDVIVTGSDQIWNEQITKGIDPLYCFKRCGDRNNCMLVSYAASVGSVEHFKKVYHGYEGALSQYDWISVREQDARDYLSDVQNRQIYKVVDPTILIDVSFWNRFITKEHKDIPYVLYYDAAKNEEAKKVAIWLARKMNCKLIHFNEDIKPNKNYSLAVDSGPTEFLNLIYAAEYVVTSSFHATVFSIIFKKEFITVAHPVTGSRVRTLLKDLGLENRLYNMSDNRFHEEKIDYSLVHSKMQDLRKESVQFFNEIFEV